MPHSGRVLWHSQSARSLSGQISGSSLGSAEFSVRFVRLFFSMESWAEEQGAEVRVWIAVNIYVQKKMFSLFQIDAILEKLGVGEEVKAKFRTEKVTVLAKKKKSDSYLLSQVYASTVKLLGDGELTGLGLKMGDRVMLRELCAKAVKSKAIMPFLEVLTNS